MGKSTTGKTSQAPGYASEVSPVVAQLGSLFGAKGTQPSPFYSDLQRMYKQTLGTDSFALPDYVTKTLESAAATGMPSATPLEQTQFYKAVQPTFAQTIQDVLGSTKEQFGAQGALRSSAYEEAAGKGVMSALSNQIMNAAQQAYGLEEAAKGRQMQGATAGMQAALTPYTMAQAGGQAAQTIDASEYPLIAAMLSYVASGAGEIARGKQYGSAGQSVGCCFIMNENDDLTESVRQFRDSYYPITSYVAKGYRMMAKWLVPVMRRNKIVKRLVKVTMTSPLAKCAEHYGELKAIIYSPIGYFWTLIWSMSARVRYGIS